MSYIEHLKPHKYINTDHIMNTKNSEYCKVPTYWEVLYIIYNFFETLKTLSDTRRLSLIRIPYRFDTFNVIMITKIYYILLLNTITN